MNGYFTKLILLMLMTTLLMACGGGGSNGGAEDSIGPISILDNDINNAPTVSGSLVTTVEESTAYSFTPTTTDTDAGTGASIPVVSYAPTTVDVADNFDNGVLANADIEDGFWDVTEDNNVTVQETNGALVIDASGDAADTGRLLSQVSYRFNFFVQPLRSSLKGLVLKGDVTNAGEKQLQLALTSTKQSWWAAPDALNLTLQGDGRIILAWKTDLPGTDNQGDNVLLDRTLPQVPTELSLTLDQTSYRLTAAWSGGSYSVSGTHAIPMTAWGDRGDSALSLEGSRHAVQADGTTARLKLDAMEVVSLKFFDAFGNTRVADTGQRTDFWQIQANDPDGVLESAGELHITNSGAGSDPRSLSDLPTVHFTVVRRCKGSTPGGGGLGITPERG